MEPDLNEILPRFGLGPSSFKIERIGTGHINRTYKITSDESYILQHINTKVFVRPEIIESNLREAAAFLNTHHPGHGFMAPLVTVENRGMMIDREGSAWRLYPYLENTFTIDEAETIDQAYQAAAEFGKLSRLFTGCNISRFKPTIDRFHDLSHRYAQFAEALSTASPDRIELAKSEIFLSRKNSFLVDRYTKLIEDGILTLGIFHNDTKINNVLFNSVTQRTIGVIDLDTLMPGYFIYDLGDLLRTLVSPVSEEEKDLNKVVFRQTFYDAVVDGYLSEMSTGLSDEEKKQVPFSGPMMTYIMALRFLADFLRGDTYYHTTYPGQNLVRAKNQLWLLELLLPAVLLR